MRVYGPGREARQKQEARKIQEARQNQEGRAAGHAGAEAGAHRWARSVACAPVGTLRQTRTGGLAPPQGHLRLRGASVSRTPVSSFPSQGRRRNIRSRTTCPFSRPWPSNLVNGRNSGRGA